MQEDRAEGQHQAKDPLSEDQADENVEDPLEEDQDDIPDGYIHAVGTNAHAEDPFEESKSERWRDRKDARFLCNTMMLKLAQKN